jgi:anti-sigma regulatory factor (Ser/Thr protein kinase)
VSLGICELRVNLPSTLEAVEGFCREFRAWRTGNDEGPGAFDAELLLREALTNSVMHGCPNDPDKHICCVVRAKKGRLLILVRDEGTGFNWRAAWDRDATISDTSGRGISIFRHYANQVRFNPEGNTVTLLKRS